MNKKGGIVRLIWGIIVLIVIVIGIYALSQVIDFGKLLECFKTCILS